MLSTTGLWNMQRPRHAHRGEITGLVRECHNM